MKDEIKEILDKLREQYNTDSKLGKEIANEFGKYQLNYKELTLLLDYITNLQEENKVLLEKYSTIQILYNSSKLKNEKAIEYMNNYIEVEDAPINERIKTEFKEVIRLLTGGDK